MPTPLPQGYRQGLITAITFGRVTGAWLRIRRSSFARNVTLIDWPMPAGQMPAYQDFCATYAARYDWAAFIDIDEFIMPVTGSSATMPIKSGSLHGLSMLRDEVAVTYQVQLDEMSNFIEHKHACKTDPQRKARSTASTRGNGSGSALPPSFA